MLETDARDRVIVALDCDRERALELAHELSGHAAWLKVGMTLYYAEGPEIVKTFKDLGFKVFLDLKFHDIPHQVRGAARSASLAGADLLSVHGLGSGAMLAACREGAEEAREDRAKLVAITVLTSMNQDSLTEIGVESPVAEEAARLAKLAQANACVRWVPPWAINPAWRRLPRLSSAVRAILWWADPSPVPTTRLPHLTLSLPSWSKTSPKRFPQVTTFGSH